MNPNCVAGLVLFTPSSSGFTIYQPGKPGEIVEIITEDRKEFVPENPGLFFKKDPYKSDRFFKDSLVSIRQKVRKDPYKYVVLKIFIDFYRFFIDFSLIFIDFQDFY